MKTEFVSQMLFLKDIYKA